MPIVSINLSKEANEMIEAIEHGSKSSIINSMILKNLGIDEQIQSLEKKLKELKEIKEKIKQPKQQEVKPIDPEVAKKYAEKEAKWNEAVEQRKADLVAGLPYYHLDGNGNKIQIKSNNK